MILYHGSNTPFEQADLARCRPNKDFGRGFYLSPEYDGALHMARRTVKRFGGEPCIMAFDLDEDRLNAASIRRFDTPSEEWALFVMANRRADRPAEDHNRDNRYGLVIGPIANDDLAPPHVRVADVGAGRGASKVSVTVSVSPRHFSRNDSGAGDCVVAPPPPSIVGMVNSVPFPRSKISRAVTLLMLARTIGGVV